MNQVVQSNFYSKLSFKAEYRVAEFCPNLINTTNEWISHITDIFIIRDNKSCAKSHNFACTLKQRYY